MRLTELTTASLDVVGPALDSGPITMINLLWFREAAGLPAGSEQAKAEARRTYFEDYVGAFLGIVRELGIEGVELAFLATQAAGLVRAPDDDWDDIAIIRYGSYSDFRRIVESETYARLNVPARDAALANWRLIATRSRELEAPAG